MPLQIASLRAASTRAASAAKSVVEARQRGARTVFLCHSHQDAELVRGLVTLLSEAGWSAYVDWADTQMPPTPSRETALRIQKRIIELDLFMYLATPNSDSSRWCPWEIGFAGGKKQEDQIIVCPTTDGTSTHGAEYLELYRRLDVINGRLTVLQPKQTTGIPVSQV